MTIRRIVISSNAKKAARGFAAGLFQASSSVTAVNGSDHIEKLNKHYARCSTP